MNSAFERPVSIIPPELFKEFREWAFDGGSDESYFDVFDSKSEALALDFIGERAKTSDEMNWR